MKFSRALPFEPHPAGIFRAQFTEWKEDKHETYGERVKMAFDTEALMKDGRPFRISVWSSPSFHEKSWVARFLKALGIDPDEFTDEEVEEFTLDDYIGRKVMLVIENETGKDGNERAKVASIQPIPRRKPQPAPEPDEEEAPPAKPAAKTAAKANGAGKPAKAPEDPFAEDEEPAPTPAKAGARKAATWDDDED